MTPAPIASGQPRARMHRLAAAGPDGSAGPDGIGDAGWDAGMEFAMELAIGTRDG